jgi:hypothetical protein
VIKALKDVCGLQRHHITGLFDNADDVLLPARIAANPTEFLLRQIEALGAGPDDILDSPNRFGQFHGFFRAASQDVMCQPIRRLPTDARQSGELINQVSDRWPERMCACLGATR